MAIIKVKSSGVDNTVNLGRRNMIINGAMQVAQRGTSGSSSSSSGYQSVDRMRWSPSATDQLAVTLSQSTDAPDGFEYSCKINVDTAEALFTTTEFHALRYVIEGKDCERLAFGTPSAKKTTLSFWIKSSVTGDYAVLFFNDNGVDPSRSQTLTYTINSANTWEYKTITFDGDTAQVLHTGINAGVDLYFILAAGPDRISTDGTSWGTYVSSKAAYGHTATMGSAINDTWQITGLQFETSDTATPFEHRSYGEELALCHRYYQRNSSAGYDVLGVDGTAYNTTSWQGFGYYQTPLRTIPSLEWNNVVMSTLGGTVYTVTNISIANSSNTAYRLETTTSGISTGGTYFLRGGPSASGDGYFAFDAEL